MIGRKVHKDALLREIYHCAQNSIGLPVNLDSMAVKTFQIQVARFDELNEQRKTLEAKADQFLSQRNDYQKLRSLPGVGPIVALIIIAESGDLRRFKHYRQYLNFCGFNLSAQQSGNQKGTYRLSKRGNARLHYGFWLAAGSAIRGKENSFADKYRRYIRQDPNNPDIRRKAFTAVAAKMARVAHALVKTDTSYRCYYEVSHGT